MTRSDQLRRIQALETKTVERGATPEEAASAHSKAQELRKKYQIFEPIFQQPAILRRDDVVTYDNNTNRWVHVPGGWVPPYTYGVVMHTSPVTGRPDATIEDILKRGRTTWHER